jgi:DNA repair protein RadC
MADNKDDKNNNVHRGHRKKMRQRFITSDNLDGFADHEVLELLLYYAYPMRDTNELAHRFIDSYGSLYNLMNDAPENIMERLKVTENVAVLISLIPKLYSRCQISGFGTKPTISGFTSASRYFTALLGGESKESLCMLLLNKQKKLIAEIRLASGSVDGANLTTDTVVRQAIACKASYAVIGHNHPSGGKKPSREDVAATDKIIRALSLIGVTVMDHIIVCSNDYKENFSFAREGYFFKKNDK